MSVVINPILDYVPNDLRPYSDNTYKLGDNAMPLRWAELHAMKGYFYDDVNIGGNMLVTSDHAIKTIDPGILGLRDDTWSNFRDLMIRTDHDAAIDLVVQGSWTKDFTEDLWEIDQFTLSASVAGTNVYEYNTYDETFGYIRVIATAQAVPGEGDIDVWISTE